MKVKGMSKKEYIAIAASIAVVAVVGVSMSSVGTKKDNKEIKNPDQVNSSDIGNTPVKSAQLEKDDVQPKVSPVTANKNETVPKTAPEKPNVETKKEEQTSEAVPPETPDTTQKTDEQQTSQIYEDEYEEAGLFEDTVTFMWPVEGEIVLDFSNDAVVYDPTLEQFRTNDNVCILANVGSEVVCAADGKVTSVTDDFEKGTVVVVDHGDGWTTTYSQLSDDKAVSVGDKVKKGEKIGNVSEPTAFGAAIGSHLEFKICQGDIAIDPKSAVNG
ncbi:MAG: M23 family metallopeptidase [Firmicutes bacterium]|nr:M23 family metallopeptidase [Bacillota bacterium]